MTIEDAPAKACSAQVEMPAPRTTTSSTVTVTSPRAGKRQPYGVRTVRANDGNDRTSVPVAWPRNRAK